MEEMTKHYIKDDLTVVWQPHKCIHSRNCFNGLSAVFNPEQRPWINVNAAEKETIMQQITKCPSGALSYITTTENKDDTGQDIVVNTSVEAMRNGPLMVYGDISVKDSKGNEVKKNKVTAFCRCGASSNKPYCDGSHIRIGFKDE